MSLTCHSFLRFATLRDVSCIMTEKTVPKRTLDRKKREAAALKANMKRRKEQAKTGGTAEKPGNLRHVKDHEQI